MEETMSTAEAPPLEETPNTSFKNFIYWFKRTFFFWRYSPLEIEIDSEVMRTLCVYAHEKNMSLDQLITNCLNGYIKKYS